MPDPKRARPEVNALVSELLERLARSDVREIEVRRNGIRVRVGRGSFTPISTGRASPAPPPAAPDVPAAPAAGPAALQITAPLTGIFYRSPSPQAAPFVQIGRAVAAGDVVALIEAMKLFNEIRSTKSGVVRHVLAENGQLVKAHQPLFELDPV